MILPSKHIRLSESYLGMGGYILSLLKTPATIDDLWNRLQKEREFRPPYFSKISIEDIVLSLNLLFAIGAINIDEKGKLNYASPST
jgi:hypothetical protein